MNKTIFLDIMLEGSGFYKQLKYTKRGMPELIDDKIEEVYNWDDFKEYAEEQLPSLKHRKYYIIPSNQRV